MVLGLIYAHANPSSAHFVLLPDTGGAYLMALAPLFAWFPIAAIAGNLLVASFPPARRALDEEAERLPASDLKSANQALLRIAAFVTPIGLAVASVGLLIP